MFWHQYWPLFFNDHEKVADLVNNAPLVTHCIGEDKRYIWSNKFEHEKKGFDPGKLVEKHVLERHVEPNATTIMSKTYRKAVTRKERVTENHFRFLGKDGKEYDMILTAKQALNTVDPSCEMTLSEYSLKN